MTDFRLENATQYVEMNPEHAQTVAIMLTDQPDGDMLAEMLGVS